MAEERYKILIIEDDRVSAMTLRQVLIRLGHDVVGHASSVTEALELAQRVQPDLLLTDVTLGAGGSGIQAAESINQIHSTPVIFITGHSEQVLEIRTLGECYGYLRKPITVTNLQAIIQQLMANTSRDPMRKIPQDPFRN